MNTGINSDYGKRIISAIADGTSVSFPTPYVGLLGEGGGEISYPEYCRVPINVKGITGLDTLADAVSETVTDTQTYTDENGETHTYAESKVKSSVKNQDYIYFPENETGGAVTVAALGLFSDKKGGAAYLTGWLKNERNEKITVTVNPNSIPIFRIGKFKVSVK